MSNPLTFDCPHPRNWVKGIAVFVVAVAAGVMPSSAVAAFPGANGKIAFESDRDVFPASEIYVMDADGQNQTRLNNTGVEPAWSPDGTRIAFMSFRDDGSGEIYVMDADGQNQTRLTNNTYIEDREPAWSPDGTRIAFQSYRDGHRGIYVMDADGQNQTRLTTKVLNVRDDYVSDTSPAWSPDGQRIAFNSDRDTSSRGPITTSIYVMDADGQNQTRLTNNGFVRNGDPAWSPDGQQIAFEGHDGEYYIYVMDADGQNQTRLTNGRWPAWSPDGRQIAFATTRDDSCCEIYVMDADGQNQTRLTNVTAVNARPDWQPLPSTAINSAAETLPDGGGTVSTNTQVSPSDPIGASVTSPVGGLVAISETTETGAAPSGYDILGQQVNIEAPDASAENPLRLVFRLDASLLPAGADASTLQVFRDGSPMSACTGAAGTASPDPCVADRQTLEGGDVELTILTSHASVWNFGLHEPFAFQGLFLPPTGRSNNTYAAGSTVPVRFSLGGNQGLGILASGYPRSRACGSSEAGSPTSGSLKYDPKKNQYTYTWRTSKQWSSALGGGPCREFVLRLTDGSTHTARVTFA